jgi:hypothetical protein
MEKKSPHHDLARAFQIASDYSELTDTDTRHGGKGNHDVALRGCVQKDNTTGCCLAEFRNIACFASALTGEVETEEVTILGPDAEKERIRIKSGGTGGFTWGVFHR